MYFLYQTGVYSYYLFILLASLFNKKAKQWIEGRSAQRNALHQSLSPAKRIWFHFASLGEFEQGRVLLEKIHHIYPEYKFIVTFFSPSGYEVRKNYSLAEKVYYLPLDTSKNARIFLDHIQPELIFFNKYEYWHHYISEAKTRNIPLFVSSAIFREDQLFFKPYGWFQRSILKAVKYFFVQNNSSLSLLKKITIDAAMVAGDTRFDRVYEHSQHPKEDELIANFCLNEKVLVAGSSWSADEKMIAPLLNVFPDMKFIIVPHEIHESHINEVLNTFGEDAVLYTHFKDQEIPKNKRVLIVNTIGLLNSIYQYATYCYIGGGFGAGIHNTLEAAAYGKPIFFGPNYKKFNEAKDLLSLKAATSITSTSELIEAIKALENSSEKYKNACHHSKNYVHSQKGASDLIIQFLQRENYLN